MRNTFPKAASPLSMTADALASLNRAGFSRRDFLKTSGALIVGFSIAAPKCNSVYAQESSESSIGAPPANQLDSWIAIAADGSVTAYTGKAEIGQGIEIAQTQLVAEELSVPLRRVTLLYCDTELTPDQGITSGSRSHPENFNSDNLAQAAASAREALLRLAAAHLGEPSDQLMAVDGVISSKNAPSKKVTYGQLVGGKKFKLALDSKAKRKPMSQWTVLGTPAKRSDIPAVVTGQLEYVQNVRVPGMLHGRVVRPPAVGATVFSVDEASVKDVPGLVKVVVKKNFVGVVAQRQWQAIQAAGKLNVTWTRGAGLPSHSDFYESVRNQKRTRDTLAVDSKDVEQQMAGAAKVLKATYHHPYQMHGSVGSSCAVADVQDGKATIWSATQGVWPQRNTAAMILGMKPESVRVIFRRGSGCYGLNGADTASYDAALLSQAVGKPVRVQLSRKDEMAWENYGSAFVIDQRAGVDAQGNIVAWDHEGWQPILGGRPWAPSAVREDSGRPGNIITGLLVGFPPDEFTPRTPAPAPTLYNNRSNAVPSYVAAGSGSLSSRRGQGGGGCVGAVCEGSGTIKSARVLVHSVLSSFWTGPLRAPGQIQNTFAHESFMDELAAGAKADPVAYRLRHLKEPRLIEVLKAAAKAANWDARSSPKPGIRNTGVATGHGVACVAKGDNGFCAMIAEVEVNQDSGYVTVKRIFIGNNSGPISNPDGLRNQLEGGAIHGISRALLEEVTWDDQKVTSVDWRTYHSLPLGFEIPKIEIMHINRPEDEVMGAGETSITVVAAAIGNAIFDATGVRIRQIPFTPERVKAAVRARS